VKAGSNTSSVAARLFEGDKNGARCLGVHLGQPITGGHKFRGLILQVGGWKQGLRPCSVKKNKITVAKSKEMKIRWTNWSRNRQDWQNLLRKSMAHTGLFCEWWRYNRNYRVQINKNKTGEAYNKYEKDYKCIRLQHFSQKICKYVIIWET
jgi:hypothetical protein